jgi:uncharacterized protein (TIGR03435 family)
MTRAVVCAAFTLAAHAWGQTFDVASVKPSETPVMGRMMVFSRTNEPGRVNYKFMSLRDLVRTAYDVKDYQVTAPDWMATARFDVEAKYSPDIPKDKVPQMLQALLAERFHLTVHREKKELPAYALVVGKNGPKLKESEETPAPPPTDAAGGPSGSSANNTAATSALGAALGGGRAPVVFNMKDGKMDVKEIQKMMGGRGMFMLPGHTIANKTTMAAFADMLSRQTDRPVVDETGLPAKYDFTLEFTPENGAGGPVRFGMGGELAPGSGSGASSSGTEMKMPEAPSAPPLAAALQQQLGLKLEPKKLPLDIVVVDHAEKVPTEN